VAAVVEAVVAAAIVVASVAPAPLVIVVTIATIANIVLVLVMRSRRRRILLLRVCRILRGRTAVRPLNPRRRLRVGPTNMSHRGDSGDCRRNHQLSHFLLHHFSSGHPPIGMSSFSDFNAAARGKIRTTSRAARTRVKSHA